MHTTYIRSYIIYACDHINKQKILRTYVAANTTVYWNMANSCSYIKPVRSYLCCNKLPLCRHKNRDRDECTDLSSKNSHHSPEVDDSSAPNLTDDKVPVLPTPFTCSLTGVLSSKFDDKIMRGITSRIGIGQQNLCADHVTSVSNDHLLSLRCQGRSYQKWPIRLGLWTSSQ